MVFHLVVLNILLVGEAVEIDRLEQEEQVELVVEEMDQMVVEMHQEQLQEQQTQVVEVDLLDKHLVMHQELLQVLAVQESLL
jgi:hypothetical protein